MQCQYYWSRFYQFIINYVKHCHVCARSMISRQKKRKMFKFLSISEQRWQNISINFVIDLFKNNNLDAIIIVIDRFFKKRHFSYCFIILDVENLAALFMKDIWKLHDLSRTIISNRKVFFVANFWKSLCKRLRIQDFLFTIFHSKIDEQTKRVNFFMKQYLRMYFDYLLDNWMNWLSLTKFSKNYAILKTIEFNSFYAKMKFHFRIQFELVNETLSSASLNAKNFVIRMQEICKNFQKEMQFSQTKHGFNVNEHRISISIYQIKDNVWLNVKNIRIQKSARKLNWKKLDSFRVFQVVNKYAYRSISFQHENSLDVLRPASDFDFSRFSFWSHFFYALNRFRRWRERIWSEENSKLQTRKKTIQVSRSMNKMKWSHLKIREICQQRHQSNEEISLTLFR